MTEANIREHIRTALPGVHETVASSDSYFFYDPTGDDPQDRMFPFATLVTSNAHDEFSRLDRPGVFRLNIGISKVTFAELFKENGADASTSQNYDFAALDVLLPHPVYGKMYWMCVLNPSAATFEKIKPLLAEAHAAARERYDKRHP